VAPDGLRRCETRPVPDLRLILASSSPRRCEILSRVSEDFTVLGAEIDESPHAGEAPEDYVVRLAVEKAAAVSETGSVTVGADTVVVLDGEILGKPTDRTAAASMLRRLAGREHDVLTGVAVVVHHAGRDPQVLDGLERSAVSIRLLDEATIDWYLATGEADDKAGAYGLQGRAAVFADVVHGSVTNVIGLPLPLVVGLLSGVGVLPWER
jgi:septum formation protein